MASYPRLQHWPQWLLNTAIFKPTRDRGIGQLIRKIEDEVRPPRPSVDIADLGSRRVGRPHSA